MTNHWDYGYDVLGQLASAKGFESGGGSRAQEQLTYGYDLAGNLQSRTNNGMVQSFNVNSLNELTSVSRTGGFTVAGATTPSATNVTVKANGDGGQVATLYADKTFVRTNVSLLNGNNTFSAEAADALGRKDTNTVTVNLPASVSYTYDLNGNLTSDGYRAFAYDDADQLTAVQVTNVWRSEFVYDGFGRRRIRREKVWKNSQWVVAAEVRYVYDGMLVIQERDGNNVPTVSYTRGRDLGGGRQRAGGIGGLLALTQPSAFNPQHFYYYSDGNGNVTSLLDSHQTVAARYQYDPFGNLLASSGSMADVNLYRFSSKEAHVNSGLYYYGYRFYEPGLQRWINADPIEEDGGINLYGFVFNDPMGTLDLWGLDDDLTDVPGLDGDCPTASSGREADFAEGVATFNEAGKLVCKGLAEQAALNAVGGLASKTACKVGSSVARKLLSKARGLFAKTCRKAAKTASQDVRILGRYPEYVETGKLGGQSFQVPPSIWEKLTEAERWAANQKFLDRGIARSDRFFLSSTLSADTIYTSTGQLTGFAKEVDYLFSKGYVFSSDGRWLIPGP
jgi:RHS repeat-associated protein